MAYDYLKETTYTKDLEQQQELLKYFTQMSQKQGEQPEDASFDDSLVPIADEEQQETTPDDLEEVGDQDTDELSTDTHDFENEDVDETDQELMSFLMGEQEPADPRGAGSYINAQTVHTQDPTPKGARRPRIWFPEEEKYGGKSKYQFGGGTLYAEDESTLRRGLNNPNYNSAMLNLKGTNTIRGLDNHQPVKVTDGSKYKILFGPKDTAKFKGNVYEQRM